jgi:ABC-type Mn2+/Zn2+ transport system permease subunit
MKPASVLILVIGIILCLEGFWMSWHHRGPFNIAIAMIAGVLMIATSLVRK